MNLSFQTDWGYRRPQFTQRAVLALCQRQTDKPDPHISGRSVPLFSRGLGICPVCGLPRYRFGAWWEAAGPNNRGEWHSVCAGAFRMWRNPADLAKWLARRQGMRCAVTGEPLAPNGYLMDVEVDHCIPLWRVPSLGVPWPAVLAFWGPANLQALSVGGHAVKTAQEARERARLKSVDKAPLQEKLLFERVIGS